MEISLIAQGLAGKVGSEDSRNRIVDQLGPRVAIAPPTEEFIPFVGRCRCSEGLANSVFVGACSRSDGARGGIVDGQDNGDAVVSKGGHIGAVASNCHGMYGIGAAVAPADEMTVGLGRCLKGDAGTVGVDAAACDGTQGGVVANHRQGVLVVGPIDGDGDGLTGKSQRHDDGGGIQGHSSVDEAHVDAPAAKGVAVVGGSPSGNGIAYIILVGARIGNNGALERLVVHHGHGHRSQGEMGREGGVAHHDNLADGVGVAVAPAHEVGAGGSGSHQGGRVAVVVGAAAADATQQRVAGESRNGVLLGGEISRSGNVGASHIGRHLQDDRIHHQRIAKHAHANLPVGEMIARVGHSGQSHGVAHMIHIGAGGGKGGTHGAVVRGHGEGHRGRARRLTSNQVVYGHLVGGIAAGYTTYYEGGSVAVCIACQGVGTLVSGKLAAGSIAAGVTMDGNNHVVGAVPEEAGIEINLLPVGASMAQIARVHQLEVSAVLDETASQRGGGGVHHIYLAIAKMPASCLQVSGFESHTLNLTKTGQTAGRNDDFGIAVVVVAVAGEVTSGIIGAVDVSHRGGGIAAAHDRICGSDHGHIPY